MYVCGSARSTGSGPIRPRPTREEHSRDADPDVLLGGQRLHDAEARVVPRRLVVVPGVSEADDARRGYFSFSFSFLSFFSGSSRALFLGDDLALLQDLGLGGLGGAPSAAATGSSSRVGCVTWTTTFSGLSTMRDALDRGNLRDADRVADAELR